MRPNPNKPTLLQAACLLLVSAALGVASNALHPSGLRWGEANAANVVKRAGGAGTEGIYRNETLYANETLVATLAPQDARVASHTVASNSAEIPTGSATPSRSTWMEVKPLVESGRLVLVDARPKTAYDAGHIPGAVCLPFKSLQAEIKAFMSAYPPTTPLAIYCANASCGTSSQMAAALTRVYKYKDVRYLPGGYQEWRNAEGK